MPGYVIRRSRDGPALRSLQPGSYPECILLHAPSMSYHLKIVVFSAGRLSLGFTRQGRTLPAAYRLHSEFRGPWFQNELRRKPPLSRRTCCFHAGSSWEPSICLRPRGVTASLWGIGEEDRLRCQHGAGSSLVFLLSSCSRTPRPFSPFSPLFSSFPLS